MTNGTKNKVVEFAYDLDLAQRVGVLSEQLKKETRSDRRKEIQDEIDNLAYNVLIQNKDHFNIDDSRIADLTPKELRENPRNEDLYKRVLAFTNEIPLDRSNMNYRNDLEGILNDFPRKYVDGIGVNPEFSKALGNDSLVRDYEKVIEKAGKYKTIDNVVGMYKEKGKFEGENAERLEAIFYSSISEAIGEKIGDNLKSKGYGEDSQNLAKSIATLAARSGLVKKDLIENSADKAVENAEKEFREYEASSGKRLVDYVKQGLQKLGNEKDTEKYNLGKELVYIAAKEYIEDNKLGPSEDNFHRNLKP